MPDILTVEKLYDERLWILLVHENSRAAVDAWEATVRAYIQHVNNAPDRCLIYDLTRATRLTFTNYMRERSTALAKDNRDATGRVALVVRAAPGVTYIFDVFLRYTSRQLQPRLDVKLFNDRDKALEWVSANLPQIQVNPSS